jgi:NAD(P)H-hydrate epimerase
MREGDRRAVEEHGMPSILLMERAGWVSAHVILARHPDRRSALVVVGPGNNGGDGMVVARHLAEAGWSVTVVAPEGREPEAPDAAVMTAIARSLGLAVEPLTHGFVDPDGPVVVDALLGTGASGAPRGPIGAAVAWMAALQAPVVALDVPSGVEADTGRAPGDAVRAGSTVTYHGHKVGLWVEPGRGLAGQVVVADIGIPSAFGLEPVAWLAGPAAVAAVPPKDAIGDKYRAGAVLVVAGAPGLTGAGCLCARAALRAGAGLVVAAAPAEVQPIMAAQLLEVMCAPVPGGGGHLAPSPSSRSSPRPAAPARSRSAPASAARRRRQPRSTGCSPPSSCRWCWTRTACGTWATTSAGSPAARPPPCSRHTPGRPPACSASRGPRSRPAGSTRPASSPNAAAPSRS